MAITKEMIVGAAKQLAEKAAPDIETENPGILEVPEGKKVDDLPASHFEGLVKKKGLEAVVKALMNLWRWNQEKNPSLSKWAKDMQEKISAKFTEK